jgi:polyhydroxyalkanoate synthesis regulator phasin
MDELRHEVQEFQERWNSMVLDITEDLKITCDEAKRVSKWLVTERKAYNLLKKKINLEIRTIRADYGVRLTQIEDATTAKMLRLEQSKQTHPYRALLLSIDELLLKADEMKLRLDRLLEKC